MAKSGKGDSKGRGEMSAPAADLEAVSEDGGGFVASVCYIYGLFDPTTSQLRYVGKADNVRRRYLAHLRDKTDSYKARWVKALQKRGAEPEVHILEMVNKEEWQDAESFWIEYARSLGCNLVNTMEGGKRVPVCVPKGGNVSRLHMLKMDMARSYKWAKETNPVLAERLEQKLMLAALKAPHLFGNFARRLLAA